jgi:LmbE family N-acetylglucosaminyl deacetylase
MTWIVSKAPIDRLLVSSLLPCVAPGPAPDRVADLLNIELDCFSSCKYDIEVLGAGMVAMIESFALLMARRLRPEWIRSFWARAGVDALAPPRAIDLPSGNRLLILAPHPDDESIGCGGMVAKWISTGRKADIVVLTDGAAGFPRGDARKDHSQLAAQRKKEAQAAALKLGGPDLHFLGFPDGRLIDHVAEAGARLAEIIRQLKADVVALPFPADRHPDHTATSKAIGAALNALTSDAWPNTFLCYEVWSPLMANTLIDISAFLETKSAAIAAHASQTAQFDYVGAALALNRYRGESGLNGMKYAEAFWMGDTVGFRRLCASVQL